MFTRLIALGTLVSLIAALLVTLAALHIGQGTATELIAVEINADNDLDIVLVDVNQGLRVNISRPDSQDTAPFWSPDGRTLGFIRIIDAARGQREVITLFDTHGGTTRQIDIHSASIDAMYDPTFTADGTQIIFGDLIPGFFEETRLPHLLSMDGEVRELDQTADLARDYIAVDRGLRNGIIPAPDGSQILEVVQRAGAWYLVLTTGTQQRTLREVSALTATPRARVTWSADGAQVAYLDDIDGRLSLVVLDVVTNQAQMYTGPYAALDLAWAP